MKASSTAWIVRHGVTGPRLASRHASAVLVVALGCGPSSESETSTDGTTASEPFPEPCVPPEAMGGVCDLEEVLCGNGQIDTCEICNEACYTVSEPCDGSEVGTATCASFGYVSGPLLCNDTCRIDWRDCESCVAPSDRATCSRPRVDAQQVASLALASKGDILAAAWIGEGGLLHFSLFDQSLQLIESRPCGQDTEAYVVGLAATSEGWVVATGSWDTTTLLLRSDLGEESTTQVSSASWPRLVGQPGSPPVLVYANVDFANTNDAPVHARALTVTGESLWDVEVFASGRPSDITAAFADPGVVVGNLTNGGPLEFVALDSAGAVGTPSELDDGARLDLASADPGFVIASWRNTDDLNTYYTRIDSLTSTLGPVVSVSDELPRALAFADGTGVVASSDFEILSLALAHVEIDGTVSLPSYDIAIETGTALIKHVAAARLGDRVVFAYATGTDRFVLANVTP